MMNERDQTRGRRFRFALSFAFISLAAFVSLAALQDQVSFSVYHARDLDRAREVAQGSWLLSGPETIGGGKIIGGFYYSLLALPYFLSSSSSWKLAFYWMLTLDALAAGVLWAYIAATIGEIPAGIGLALYMSSNIHLGNLLTFWNPSFLPLFSILSIIGLNEAFSGKSSSKRAWLLTCVCLCLAIQIHFSASIFILAAIILQLFPNRLKTIRLSWKTWVGGFFVFLIPLVLEFVVSKEHGFTAGSPLHALKNLFYIARLSDGDSSRVSQIAARGASLVLDSAILLIAMFAALCTRSGFERRERVFLVCILCALIPTAFYFFVQNSYRYLVCLTLSLLFFSVSLFKRTEEWTWLNRTWVRRSVSVSLLFIAFTSPHWAFTKRIKQTWFPLYSAWQPVLSYVHEMTGWDYSTARRRLVFSGLPWAIDVGEIYKDFPRVPVLHAQERPDGVLVVKKDNAIPELNEAELRSFLAEQPLPAEIAQGIRSRQIALLLPKTFDRILVVGFRWPQMQDRWKDAHNYNQAYEKSDETAVLAPYVSEVAGVARLDSNHYLFHWNECPGRPGYGVAGFLVKAQSSDNRIELTALGQNLSAPTRWVYLECTQAWIGSFVKVRCGDRDFSKPIAQSIGLDVSSRDSVASTFLAPLTREMTFPCRSPIQEIEIGRKKTVLTRYTGPTIEIPGKSLSLKLPH